MPIDHVTIRVADLARSRGFYDRVFTLIGFAGERHGSSFGHEWDDFSIVQADAAQPPTHRLHIGFATPSRAQVDEWWQGMREAGAPDDGPPALQPQYGPDYYGAFVTDPDGNSVEAVTHESTRDDGGVIDHLWIRVHDLAVAAAFYRAVALTVGLRVNEGEGRVGFDAGPETFTLLEGPVTEHLHLAFGVDSRQAVAAFHEAGLRAGGQDNGQPGERPIYHPGYWGAFIVDPDGNNVEAVFHDR